jgi:hypothetical protein
MEKVHPASSAAGRNRGLALLNRLRRLAQREFNRAGDEGNPPKADKRRRWALSDSLNGQVYCAYVYPGNRHLL